MATSGDKANARGSGGSGRRSGDSATPARNSASGASERDLWLAEVREILRQEVLALVCERLCELVDGARADFVRQTVTVIEPLSQHLAQTEQCAQAHQAALSRVDSLLTRLVDTLVRLEEARLAARVKILIALCGLLGAALGFGGSEALTWVKGLLAP